MARLTRRQGVSTPNFVIYYDSIQEGQWFKQLHPALAQATLLPFPAANVPPGLARVLAYDRPDIVLLDDAVPVLVVERTVEVPSGHNVGQRFARLAAAAQMQIPSVYFGPYAAYKHGGETQGPRFMNLRLFQAIEAMQKIEKTAVTIINWPVDQDYEIIQTPEKDLRLRAYLEIFFEYYLANGLTGSVDAIRKSSFEANQQAERDEFKKLRVRRPEQYDDPPGSVAVAAPDTIPVIPVELARRLHALEIVYYKVGMRYVRSDPYGGMVLLYSYLYCGGVHNRTRPLILHFPEITIKLWQEATSQPKESKAVRLFRLADAIVFRDGFLERKNL